MLKQVILALLVLGNASDHRPPPLDFMFVSLQVLL